jgi:type IV secretory pathway TraG/TraD family ATPase VirD4
LCLIAYQARSFAQNPVEKTGQTYTEADYQKAVQRAANLTVQEEELALKLNTGRIGPKEYYPAFSKIRPQITDLYNIYGRGDMNEKFRADIAAASVLRIQQLKRQYAPPPKAQTSPRPKIVRDPPDTAVPDSYRWKQVAFGAVAFGLLLFGFMFLVHKFFPTAPRTEPAGPELSGNYGTAAYAGYRPSIPTRLYVQRGVFFGKSSLPVADPMPVLEQPGAPLCSAPSHHTLIVARTRTGKGTRVIVPTLLRYQGSALVIDPKGENAAITARARQNIMPGMETPVHIVNPWGELGDHFRKLGFEPATFNPLDALDRYDPDAVAMAQELANTICPPLSGKDQFWQGSAAGLLTGIMLYLLDTPGETLTLARVREIVTSSRKDLTDQYLVKMAASTAFHGAVKEFASAFVDMAQDTFSGIVANAVENTRFLSDPQVKQATAKSSFNFLFMMREPTTVYLVIPPQRIATQRTWLRLVITAMTGAYKRVPMANRSPHRCMFLIDEFPALGRLPDITSDIATMAGYGVDYTLIVQGLDQLKDHYKEAAATILSNCAFKWFCNVNDLDSAKYLSDTLGKATVQTIGKGESHGDNPGGATAGESVNYGETGRSLLNPDEVLTLGKEKAIVLHPESKPHYVRPIDYWNLQTAFARMKDEAPQMYWNPPLQYDDNPYFKPGQDD